MKIYNIPYLVQTKQYHSKSSDSHSGYDSAFYLHVAVE